MIIWASPLRRNRNTAIQTAVQLPSPIQSAGANTIPPATMTEANSLLNYEADLARRAIRAGRAGRQGSAADESIDFAFQAPEYPPKPGDLTHQPFSVTAAGNNTVIAGNGGTQLEIFELMLWNVTAQTIRLLDGDSDMTGPLTSFPSTSGYQLTDTGRPHFRLRAGKAFVINLSGGTELSGFVRYRMITG